MAAAIPTTVQSTSAGFQNAFSFVGTQGDRHADAFAVIASIAGVSLKDVFRQAEAHGMPKTGPYSHCIDSDLISSLLAGYGWASTEWKEVTGLTHLPALSICLVDYDSDWEVGRYVLVHSGVKCSHDGKTISYVVDPAAADPQSQVRTDLKALKPAWYIGVQPMKASTAPAKK
jgi:hypothetical protein